MRFSGVEVDDTPKFLAPKDGSSPHMIYFPEEKVQVPLNMEGCLSIFNVQTPTLYEIYNCTTLTLTDHEAGWDPRSLHFKWEEDSFDDLREVSHVFKDREFYKINLNYRFSHCVETLEWASLALITYED
jgi:hypothetical protein